METSNRELTLSKGRFEAVSDGIFAVAITLLILEVRLPSNIGRDTPEPQQVQALISIWPHYLIYAVAFATIGIMWLNHHALLYRARRITPGVVMANFFLMGLICFLPFSTYVFDAVGVTAPAAVLYALTNVAIGFGYFFVYRTVLEAHGKRTESLTRWNIVGPSAYSLAAIVAAFYPLLSIFMGALIVVFYALPRNIEFSQRALEGATAPE